MATKRGRAQALSVMAVIRDFVQRLYDAADERDMQTYSQVEQEIREYPCDVRVRCTWQYPDECLRPDEYEIMISWGGPAIRITGYLDEYAQPQNAILQYQDWYYPWTSEPVTDKDKEMLKIFASEFYFA